MVLQRLMMGVAHTQSSVKSLFTALNSIDYITLIPNHRDIYGMTPSHCHVECFFP